ncbi:uncharacterized protein LOC119082162 [Bradysia coprophila]|uniref:uncharacterized protein LOC119082162 n=1 Tax=Bradysia coprophila TaxID=38358 RepID=UPI00187D716D|nr:uncharacterized protein LOC119082162 [Bradysia coprophila]
MTSKEYLPLRHKSVASQKPKRKYGLQSHISKVSKQAGSSASNKKNRFHSLKPVSDMKKWSTSNADSMDKCQNSCGPQSSANSKMDLSDIIEDEDFAGFTDMEDDAFQLAKYVESDGPFDEIMVETHRENRPNLTSNAVFDPRVEKMSMSAASLEELLDISILELQKAGMPCNGNTSSVTFRNSIQSQNNVANNCNSNRSDENNDESECIFVCETRSGAATFHNVQSQKSHSSSGYRRMVSNEREITGDQRRSVSASVSSHCKGAVGRTPYTTLTKGVALKQKVFHLFNQPCHKYLNDQCIGGVCKWNHSLPPARDIYHKLMLLNDETVKYMYFNFVLRTKKAFLVYFPSMCEVLGKRKMRSILIGAISKCEERDIASLKFVFSGLVFYGSSKMEALTTITDYCSKSRKCYDVLLEIMIETDALYFVDTLKQYYLYGTIRTESMYKLLQQVVDAPGTALLSVFIDVLDKYSMCRGFDEKALKNIIPRAASLVKGNLSLTQQLSNIVKRMD